MYVANSLFCLNSFELFTYFFNVIHPFVCGYKFLKMQFNYDQLILISGNKPNCIETVVVFVLNKK